MTKRFLGEYPSFYPILALSRVAINTHVGLFARMFHCPAVDMRVPTFPSPELRRIAFLVASSRFSCSYCTAHACSFGDMLRGSLTDRVRRGHTAPRVVLDADDPSLSHAERVVVAFATAAVVRPLATAELRTLAERAADVTAAIGARGLEVIKAVVAFTGALNTLTDVQGVVLEPDVQAFASLHMPAPSSVGGTVAGEEEEGLWVPSPHHRNYDVKVGGVWGQTGPAKGTAAGTDEWDSSSNFRLGIRKRLALFYVFARVTSCPALGDDAVTCMAHASGRLRSDIRAAWDAYYDVGDAGTARADVSRRLVLAVGVKTENISPELVTSLTNVLPPGAVVELASLLSFLEMWRRLRVLSHV
ncbi:hypothetical protein I4F81_001667 [Pyropia yezoensis]|uniref:Uncharacterized protein n=1 Tax=Pyropia yezoensis TaxID=2788 RepID=A0ACC3BM58_PYRYE|nr:hypothetical protein I4F81_001667 [Neopyropia yezoensis]